MDRHHHLHPALLFWSLGLMLSGLSLAVVAYRNDLSPTRHGCIWSTIDPHVKESGTTTPATTTTLLPPSLQSNPQRQQLQQHSGMVGVPSFTSATAGGFSLNCNLRTLSMDFWNYTFNREQIEKSKVVRVKCSDKLFFESLLSPNQTLFQLRNLKEVQIESCKIRKVPKRVWASLTKLKTLVIRTQNTDWRSSSSSGLELEDGAFDGLEQLEVLDLSQNNIWTFSESRNALCPLRSLLKLNVSYNRLSDIEELISSESPSESNRNSNNNHNNVHCALNVQNVDLSHNSLRRVGQEAFSRMKREMRELRLQNNLISELDDTSFEGLGELKLLNLSSNRIVALPPFIFKSARNSLQELYLQNNSISALSSQVFGNMDQLLLLDLSYNGLTSQWVKGETFQGLIRLVVLKLSYNQLTFIDSTIFKDLIHLQALHLDNQRIETINPEAFLSLSNLHILDLSHNRLTYIDGKMLSNLFVLRQLYLNHNKIRKMDDESLRNCTNLEDLLLGENSLQELPVALQSTSLGLLKTLDIGENKIVHVSNSSFAAMSQLFGLRMVENRLTELPPGFCNSVKKLRVLNLSQNLINKISSSAFVGCPELRVLRLDANQLPILPPSLAPQLPSLLWFNVSENRLKLADYNLIPSTVEWLDLSHNSIESLSGPLSLSSSNNASSPLGLDLKQITMPLPGHLRVLDVSYNKLKHLDQASIPSSLETFRVNYNGLKSVAPNTFIHSTRIRRVELIGNEIEHLSQASLRISQIPSGRTLPEFYLGSNPFSCDCNMEWLTKSNQLAISRQHPRIVDLDAITCRTTFSRSISTTVTSSGTFSSGAVIPLLEANPRDFLCTYDSHCFTLCHCCEFDACDCQMSCPSNCTCHHDNSWSTNIVECSNLEYENIPERIPMDSTEIYLDGNRLFQLNSHIFIGKKNLRTLYLNNSHVEVIKNKTFNGLKALEVLRLEGNLLSELNGYEFADLEGLRELYLHDNMLRYISPDTFMNLNFLQVLRLDGNELMHFSVWELNRNSYLNSVMLANNPWSCDCDFLNPWLEWVVSKTSIVVDLALAKCQEYPNPQDEEEEDDTGSVAEFKQKQRPKHLISSMCAFANPAIGFNYDHTGNNEIEINNRISAMGGAAEKVALVPRLQPLPPSENHHSHNHDNTFWVLLLCLTALLIIIFVLVGIFRHQIYHWTRSTLPSSESESGESCPSGLLSLCCCCPGKFSGSLHPSKVSSPSDDQEKLFDAYLLYCHKEEEMLLQKIIPELEDPTTTPGQKFRLCLHYRDLSLPPESPWNREMILSASEASKRIVLILSRTFLQSELSYPHFRQAIQTMTGLHQKKLVLILLPDFDQSMVSSVSPELSGNSAFLRNSCVQWADKSFWNKFKRLLPQPSVTIPHSLCDTLRSSNNGSGGNYQPGSGVPPPQTCDPSQLPYSLIMNPNLHHLQQLQQQQQLRTNTHHYHQNIIPYQIPVPHLLNRNNSLPPVPKHQIVLPANSTNLSNGLHHHHHHHNTLIPAATSSLIHPIPSQLTPQHFGYSNEMFHLQQLQQQSNHQQPTNFENHHHHHHHAMIPNSNYLGQPSLIMDSLQNPHHRQPSSAAVIPSSHIHSHTASQVSSSNNNFSPLMGYLPNSPNIIEGNYSSSAVSSFANDDLEHVYSTLDSPLQSPMISRYAEDVVDYSPSGNVGGGNNCGRSNNPNSKHIVQHSTSSGVSSGSDMSSAVSPSSPVKNGILNKLSGHSHPQRLDTTPATNQLGNNNNNSSNNGKMYFV